MFLIYSAKIASQTLLHRDEVISITHNIQPMPYGRLRLGRRTGHRVRVTRYHRDKTREDSDSCLRQNKGCEEDRFRGRTGFKIIP